MIKEEYKYRLSEIEFQIGQLASRRDKLICDQMNAIRDELEKIGLTQDVEVRALVSKDGEAQSIMCSFNGVRCNSQHLIYLEFVYQRGDGHSTYPEVLDINQDITIFIPNGIGFDYHPFMSKYQ